MLYLCFTPALPLAIYVTAAFPALLEYIHLYSCFTRTSYFTRTFLAVCVRVCAGLLASSSVWRKVRG